MIVIRIQAYPLNIVLSYLMATIEAINLSGTGDTINITLSLDWKTKILRPLTE